MGGLSGQICFGYRRDCYKEIAEWKKECPGQKLYVWGAGSVANGVVNELRKRQTEVDGCFVDVPDYNLDARVAGKNLPVYLLDGLISQDMEFSVVMGHSHYELAKTLAQYPQIKNVWSLSNVTRDDIDITDGFFRENEGLFEETYARLEDEQSKKNMAAYLNAQITKDDTWILSSFGHASTYFENDILTLSDDEVYLDLGAYNGDSMKKFVKSCNGFKQILAVEVQPAMCRKLEQEWGSDARIVICNTGISNYEGEAYFHFDGQSTHIADVNAGKGILMPVTTVDALCPDTPCVSIIKICIGNTVVPLLEGAGKTIRKHTPKLAIAAGIDRRALIDYIPKIEELAGKGRYKYFLRFTNAIGECLVLYAIPKEGQDGAANTNHDAERI